MNILVQKVWEVIKKIKKKKRKKKRKRKMRSFNQLILEPIYMLAES
jgi:hypothetical protein